MSARRRILRRYLRSLVTEERGRPWFLELWQPVLLAVVGLVVWKVASPGAGKGRAAPEVDYTSFFHTRAEYLGDRAVRLYYDFELSGDPLDPCPQLLDWDRKRGAVGGWLPGDASLNVAFEDYVLLSFRFRVRRGQNLMPAVGVRKGRSGKLSFVSVLIDRDGRVTVGKYLDGERESGFTVRCPFRIGLGEVHGLRLEARQVLAPYDPAADALRRREREEELHPEVAGENKPPPRLDAAGGGKQLLPAVHLVVWLDDYRILDCTVPKYELKGWVALMSWNSEVLYDEVVVEGRLYPYWVARELRIRRLLSGGGKREE